MSAFAASAVLGQQLTGGVLPPPSGTPTYDTVSGTYGDEDFVAFVPTHVDPSLRMGVLYMHGASSDETQMTNLATANGNIFAICRGLAYAGHVVMSFNADGNHWGNDASWVRIDDAIAYMQGTLGAKASWQVGMLGASMGGCGLSWAGQGNLGKLACFAGLTPVSDIQSVYDETPALRAQIDAAYGGTYSDATDGPDHNPLLLAEAGLLDGLSYKAWYGATDAIVLPQTVLDLAAALSPTGATQSVTGDHNSAIGNLGGAVNDVIDFITSHPGVAA